MNNLKLINTFINRNKESGISKKKLDIICSIMETLPHKTSKKIIENEYNSYWIFSNVCDNKNIKRFKFIINNFNIKINNLIIDYCNILSNLVNFNNYNIWTMFMNKYKKDIDHMEDMIDGLINYSLGDTTYESSRYLLDNYKDLIDINKLHIYSIPTLKNFKLIRIYFKINNEFIDKYIKNSRDINIIKYIHEELKYKNKKYIFNIIFNEISYIYINYFNDCIEYFNISKDFHKNNQKILYQKLYVQLSNGKYTKLYQNMILDMIKFLFENFTYNNLKLLHEHKIIPLLLLFYDKNDLIKLIQYPMKKEIIKKNTCLNYIISHFKIENLSFPMQ